VRSPWSKPQAPCPPRSADLVSAPSWGHGLAAPTPRSLRDGAEVLVDPEVQRLGRNNECERNRELGELDKALGAEVSVCAWRRGGADRPAALLGGCAGRRGWVGRRAQRKIASRLDPTQQHSGAPSRKRPLRDSTITGAAARSEMEVVCGRTAGRVGSCSPKAMARPARRQPMICIISSLVVLGGAKNFRGLQQVSQTCHYR